MQVMRRVVIVRNCLPTQNQLCWNPVRTQRFLSLRYMSADIDCVPDVEFRKKFCVPKRFDFRVWFPMHMHVQLQKMVGKLRSMDLIIEVHDARVPITGRNQEFYKSLYAIRPHILVMNKVDLIRPEDRVTIQEYYRKQGVQNFLWTNCKDRLKRPLSQLQKMMVKCLREEPRFNRTVKTEYQVMVVGIPNVGKSSLINSLRLTNLRNTQKACQEGSRPGVTTRVQNRVRILDNPKIYIVDTPGVLNPNARSIEEAMKLALCNLILESATQVTYVADYLLFWMNKTRDFTYVDFFKLPDGPSDDIQKVLLEVCKVKNLQISCIIGRDRCQRWDVDQAARLFIDMFRRNKLRNHCLDIDLLIK